MRKPVTDAILSQVPKFDDWVPSRQMGAGLISWIVLMSGQYNLSTRQIRSLLEQQWQLPFGVISQAQKPVRGWLVTVHGVLDK